MARLTQEPDPNSSETTLAEVRALIATYGDLDREGRKDAMVRVAIACNTYGATAIVAANEVQDLSMKRGQTLIGLSKTERRFIEQNGKLIENARKKAEYVRGKVDRLAALRQMCPELKDNNNLPQDPKHLKALHHSFKRCGYQLAYSFLQDAMYQRFLRGPTSHYNRYRLGQRFSITDIQWAAEQSVLHSRAAARSPAVLFEQCEGLPHFVSDSRYELQRLLEQAAEPTVKVPNTSTSGPMQLASEGTDERAINTTAREHDSDGSEMPPVLKTKTRTQPARKVRAASTQTIEVVRQRRETSPWYTKGRGKRAPLQADPMHSPKRQAAPSPSATSQDQQDYNHLSAPMPSPITPAIARPLVPELMACPQKQRPHTLFSSPQHAQSRSGAPMPSSIMPEVAELEIVHYYWEATTSASPFIKEESTVEIGAVLEGHTNAYAESGRMSEDIRPGSTDVLQQTTASQGDGGEGTYNNVAVELGEHLGEHVVKLEEVMKRERMVLAEAPKGNAAAVRAVVLYAAEHARDEGLRRLWNNE
ncbi:hypothetical protein LTS10_010591 [Elasticomyces elasticus]|nr:hypothetical protein LTS10_010591 [Elasticomyces elasticus]